MTTSTKAIAEKGVTNIVFAIVVMGLIFLILLGVAYIVVSDRLNGLDAYRTKSLFDHIKAEHEVCDENRTKLQSLQEWIRQTKELPPPDLMTNKPCLAPPNTEQSQGK